MTKLLPAYRKNTRFDYVLFAVVIALGLIGLVMIYSASSYSAQKTYGDSFFFVKKQFLAFIVGIVSMIAISKLDVKYLISYKYIILAVSYILLALVFIPALSIENYGARRWLNLGAFTLQPSEISKFGLMIFLAAFMDKNDVKSPKGFFGVLGFGGIMAVLIMLEPNMSITMCVVICTMLMLFVGGAKIKYFIILSIPLVIGVIALILVEPYRMARLLAFVDPWASPKAEGYQLIQSYYGLGSGGMWGVGLFNSRQKYLFLPFSESDFILSIIGEECGFVGVTIIIALFAILVFKGIQIAINCSDRFSSYLASGITIVIAVQSALNIAVVSGSIPPTGLPLPFISYGGSSLISFMSASGILLGLSAKQKQSMSIFTTK